MTRMHVRSENDRRNGFQNVQDHTNIPCHQTSCSRVDMVSCCILMLREGGSAGTYPECQLVWHCQSMEASLRTCAMQFVGTTTGHKRKLWHCVMSGGFEQARQVDNYHICQSFWHDLWCIYGYHCCNKDGLMSAKSLAEILDCLSTGGAETAFWRTCS